VVNKQGAYRKRCTPCLFMIKQNCEFFKELTYDKQVAKSVAIADAIEDKEIKATVQAENYAGKENRKSFPRNCDIFLLCYCYYNFFLVQ